MYNIGQTTTLAQLRPEKLDDAAIQTQIALVKCSLPALTMLMIHSIDSTKMWRGRCRSHCSCLSWMWLSYTEYHRTPSSGWPWGKEKWSPSSTHWLVLCFQDDGWQKAKSNNKKKSNHQPNSNELITNGNLPSDDPERPLSQHVSPTAAFRTGNGAYRRQEYIHYPSSSRGHSTRRGECDLGVRERGWSISMSLLGNASGHTPYVPSNSRYPPRHQSAMQKSTPSPLTVQEIPSESLVSVEPSNEQRTPTTTTSSSTDEFEFLAGTTQSLTFDNSLKKTSLPSLPSSTAKRPAPSSIPQQPVAMHPTVQFSSTPIWYPIWWCSMEWFDAEYS